MELIDGLQYLVPVIIVGLRQSMVSLADVTMDRNFGSNESGSVQLAFQRADGSLMRMRVDDKDKASLTFQDALLQAMSRPDPIPESAEYTPTKPTAYAARGSRTP